MHTFRGGVMRSDVTAKASERYSGNANPVGYTADPTRVLTDSSPRVRHPKLNRNPWSVSMAVKRSEPQSVKHPKRPRKPKGGRRK